MSQVIYIVQKPFDYGDRHYKQGDTFEPGDGRFDDLICENLCHEQRVNAKTAAEHEPKAGGRRQKQEPAYGN